MNEKNATKKSIPADLGVRLQIHQIVVFPTILDLEFRVRGISTLRECKIKHTKANAALTKSRMHTYSFTYLLRVHAKSLTQKYTCASKL